MSKIFRLTSFVILFLLIGKIASADMKEMHGKQKDDMGMLKENHGMQMEHKEVECPGCMKIGMILKSSKDLELTDDQIDKIQDIKIDCKKGQIKLKAEIDILKIDKKKLLMNDDMNLDETKKVIIKIHQLEGDKAFSCIEAYVKVRKLLNEKQALKLKEMINNMKSEKLMDNRSHGCMMEQGEK